MRLQGFTPLMHAAQRGYVDVAEELLCAGADLAVKTKVSSHKHAVLPGTTVM